MWGTIKHWELAVKLCNCVHFREIDLCYHDLSWEKLERRGVLEALSVSTVIFPGTLLLRYYR